MYNTQPLSYNEDDLYVMSNVYPEDSGLPMTVWVRPRSNERHGPRIKVCTIHGNRMLPDETVSVTLSPIRIVPGQSGTLSISDLRLVTQWINLNLDAIMAHWEGHTSSGQFFRQMQKISGD